jgi:hypothetical protein
MDDPVELDSGHAFRMRSAQDAFRKLHRELQRYKSGTERVDRIDAAINFAITAWHLTDWVWIIHKNRLTRELGVSSLNSSQDLMKQRCRSLSVCDVIANAAKHGGVAKQRPDRPNVETILVAHPIDGGGSIELFGARDNRRWTLKIRIDGRSEHAGDLLRVVDNFWHRFIQAHCIDLAPPE